MTELGNIFVADDIKVTRKSSMNEPTQMNTGEHHRSAEEASKIVAKV